MRKLTIINQQYPPEVASTGQIFRTIAEHMVEKGWDVTVATGTPYYPGLEKKDVPRKEEAGGVHVRRLWNTTLPKKSMAGKLLNLLTFETSLLFYCLFSIPKDQTVLVATAPPLAVVCAALGKIFRRFKLVMTVQDLYPDALAAAGMSEKTGFTYRFLEKCMKWAMHKCDKVQTISVDMQRHLENHYGLKNVALIPNIFPEHIQCVDSRTVKAQRGWEDKLVVQYSGNFGVAHECKTLFETACLLKDDPSILFQIAGSGRNYDALKKSAEEANLQNIHFEGYAPLNELENHLGRADVSVVIFDSAFQTVLLPSKYYGILASGRGVVLISGCESDISRDIARHGVGWCFSHGESRPLCTLLTDLKANPARMTAAGEKARALYEEKYTQDVLLSSLEKLLENV